MAVVYLKQISIHCALEYLIHMCAEYTVLHWENIVSVYIILYTAVPLTQLILCMGDGRKLQMEGLARCGFEVNCRVGCKFSPGRKGGISSVG